VSESERLCNQQQRARVKNICSNQVTAIKKLQRHFLVGMVDKTSHNFSVICKHLYKYRLVAELRADTYDAATISLEEIFARHKQFNTRWGLKHVDNIGYMYGQLKNYKVPKKSRFIVRVSKPKGAIRQPAAGVAQRGRQDGQQGQADGLEDPENSFIRDRHFQRRQSPEVSTTAASKALGKMLQLTIGILLKKDAQLFARSGVRRCWIITNMDEFFLRI
jgi:hypothetical protein